MDIRAVLQLMHTQKASDAFLSAGAPPHVRIDGRSHVVKTAALTAAQLREVGFGMMTEAQQKEFEVQQDISFAVVLSGLGRFRVSLYMQRAEVAMAIRRIPAQVPQIDQLGLPEVASRAAMFQSGLVLVVGAAGSGKSTTLAAMVRHRAERAGGHILTIEDPVEYVHQHARSIVDQREVGLDTPSFAQALRSAMRQSPDMIVIGEIRDRESAQHALMFADTGHLCLATLHATSANQALERMVNMFPEHAREQLFQDLALHLKSVIGQRLLPAEGGGRVLATDYFARSAYLADLIRDGRVGDIRDAMERGPDEQMQSFDQTLYALYRQGRISLRNALHYAESQTNLGLKIRQADRHMMETAPLLTVHEAAPDELSS
nr:PilT/PilU family type 4a pilus ATPase [Oceanococcus sp. HetDA_MAG_MS8]